MALSYTLREGLAGFRRTKLASAASVSALAIALVLIGMFALLGWQGQRLSDVLRESAGEAEVFLRTVDADVATATGARLLALPGVASADFVSHEDAVAIFRETFGDGADIFDDAQFLPASYRVRVTPSYAQPDSLAMLARRVGAWEAVDEVVYDQALLEAVERNRQAFTLVGLAVALLVGLAALLLVGNTVRLSIYARRMLIRTMKLVGATDGFIRRPFLVEGIVQGLAAGIAAAGVLWGLYALLLRTLRTADALGASASNWPGGSPAFSLGGVVLLGVLLGLLASWLAVRRFIRQVRLS